MKDAGGVESSAGSILGTCIKYRGTSANSITGQVSPILSILRQYCTGSRVFSRQRAPPGLDVRYPTDKESCARVNNEI